VTGKPSVVYNKVAKIRRKLTSLRSLVKTQEKQTIKIYYICVKLLVKMLYKKLAKKLEYKSSRVRLVKDDIYEVGYELKGVQYKMLIQAPRGPCPIMQVTDDNDEDITDVILPFMGPSYNWHNFRINGQMFIPALFFNVKALTFEMSDCSSQSLLDDGSHVVS